jgi:hypothetical protein
MGED